MTNVDRVIVIVDDSECIRDSVSLLLNSVGYKTLTFSGVDAFFAAELPPEACCLISDVRMPGRSGLELQDQLNRMGSPLPVILMTAFGDVPLTVRAMKAGAIDVLSKPFREQELLDAVQRAIDTGEARRREADSASQVWTRYETLTPREREILSQVASGRMNKQIAFEMGVSEITVKVHRGQVMRKMQARTFADLVRMAEALGVVPSKS